MKTRTRQELFDLAWNGLKAQGFQRSMANGRCAYRGADGFRCAIGHCIPDEHYRSTFEGIGTVLSIRRAAGIPDDESNFAEFLQLCHDGGTDPAHMQRNLLNFADDFDLTVPS